MKVAILGTGDVAKALAAGFLKHGHSVMMGTQCPATLADWQKGNSTARLCGISEAAAFGEDVVLAVKGTGSAEALRGAGPENLAGKTVIDAPNPTKAAPPTNGVLGFFT